MNLKEQIQNNFTDADGLISPHPCLSKDTNASNNGLCYLGEYHTLLNLIDKSNYSREDWKTFTKTIYSCEAAPGCYNRSPSNHRDYNSIDDYLGLCCGIYFSGASLVGNEILSYGLHNLGFYNNINPDHLNWTSFLFRFPQLVAMMLWASRKEVWFPLNIITAVIIATSCIGAKQSDGTDKFRLAWLLIQVAKRESWLCKIASIFWYRRLKKVWGNFSNVYREYYHGLPGKDHPFTLAIEELEKNGQT